MKKENQLSEKLAGCEYLANLKVKKITDNQIKDASEMYNISEKKLKSAWNNFVETGGKSVDLRVSSGKGTIRMKSTVRPNTVKRIVSVEEAGSIILDYMTGPLNSREISNKYNISLFQFYGWIKELNTSGRILGKKVLDPLKYAKLEVKDVIWLYKKPNTKRKTITTLTYAEKQAYKRVATVLLNYLPRIKNTEVA